MHHAIYIRAVNGKDKNEEKSNRQTLSFFTDIGSVNARMISKQLKIKVKDLAALEFKVFSVLVILATNYKIVTLTYHEVSPWTFGICNILAIAVWTAREIVIIDFETQTIKEGFTVLWINFVSKSRYSGFEKIFINSVATSGVFRHIAGEKTIRDKGYKAFLKTYEGEKFCIAVQRDKDTLMEKLGEYNRLIGTEVVDNTETPTQSMASDR
jgi:hypothetical protein